LRKHGVRAEAKVVWRSYNRDRRFPRWCALVGYVDQDGHTRTFLSPAHGGERLPPKGRELPVIYLPRHVKSRPPGTPAEALSFTTFGRSQAHLFYRATPRTSRSYATLLSQFLLVCSMPRCWGSSCPAGTEPWIPSSVGLRRTVEAPQLSSRGARNNGSERPVTRSISTRSACRWLQHSGLGTSTTITPRFESCPSRTSPRGISGASVTMPSSAAPCRSWKALILPRNWKNRR